MSSLPVVVKGQEGGRGGLIGVEQSLLRSNVPSWLPAFNIIQNLMPCSRSIYKFFKTSFYPQLHPNALFFVRLWRKQRLLANKNDDFNRRVDCTLKYVHALSLKINWYFIISNQSFVQLMEGTELSTLKKSHSWKVSWIFFLSFFLPRLSVDNNTNSNTDALVFTSDLPKL